MAQVYLHAALLEQMPSGVQRRRILEFLHRLAADPDLPGDFTDTDASLRSRRIKVIGDHAITYWHDSPVGIVMVVDIRHADR